MDWLRDTPWLIWLAVALAAGVVEVVTLDFVFVMVAGGAITASLTAAFGLPVAAQVIVFAAATAALLLVARPPLKHWAERTPVHATNAGALVGRDAVVLETVSERAGQVKLAGEVWTARVGPGGDALEVGSQVRVVRIDGATAVVAAPEPPALDA